MRRPYSPRAFYQTTRIPHRRSNTSDNDSDFHLVGGTRGSRFTRAVSPRNLNCRRFAEARFAYRRDISIMENIGESRRRWSREHLSRQDDGNKTPKYRGLFHTRLIMYVSLISAYILSRGTCRDVTTVQARNVYRELRQIVAR